MNAPLPTVKRGPLYLRILMEYDKKGIEWISATDIASRLNLTSIQVRKDLSLTGNTGMPKKGFHVKELMQALLHFLGWDSSNDAFLVGAGALGSALLGYRGFEEHGLNIIAAFDNDPLKIGKVIHGKKVLDIKKLKSLSGRMNIKIGIITVPENHAQETADILIEAGIKGIWNFSPVKLLLPDGIIVQREDLSSGFAVLSAKIAKLEKENDDN